MAKYCDTNTVTDKLKLTKTNSFTEFAISSSDYIEVVIKTQILDQDGSETPRKTPSAGFNNFLANPMEQERR